jgi:hypothetical protein
MTNNNIPLVFRMYSPLVAIGRLGLDVPARKKVWGSLFKTVLTPGDKGVVSTVQADRRSTSSSACATSARARGIVV